LEQAYAVSGGVIEKKMTQRRYQRAEIEISPTHRQTRRSFDRLGPSPPNMIYEIDERQHCCRDKRRAHEAVCNSAMVLQPCGGALERPNDIDIGGFGGEHHGQRGESALAIEAGAPHAGAGQKMSERVQVFPRLSVTGSKTAIVRKRSPLAVERYIIVTGLARKQIDSVRQNVLNCPQRLLCTTWTARQVEDERASAHAAQAATQNGEPRVRRSFCAHSFRDAINQLRANRTRGFGRNIAHGDAGSTGGDDQLRLLTESSECRLDRRLIVGNDLSKDNLESCLAEQFGGGWTGDVGALSAYGGITNGQYSSGSLAHGRTISR